MGSRIHVCSSVNATFGTVIIGAGPAGLFCGARLAGPGERVLVLEKNPGPGKKLGITGSGQCNITHDGEIREFLPHYGDHGRFLKPALFAFSNRDLIGFFTERGCPMQAEPGGKVFPVSRRASDIRNLLVSECKTRGAVIRCGEPATGAERQEGEFLVTTRTGVFRTHRLVIATGGASYPSTGSSGDGYRIAGLLGQPVTQVAPALVPVVVRNYPFTPLAGISFDGLRISLYRDGKKIREGSGDLLLTHTGLSGPGILDLSRYLVPGDVLHVGFVRDDPGSVRERLIGLTASRGGRETGTIMQEFGLPERFVRALLGNAGISPHLPGAQLPRDVRETIVRLLTAFPFDVERLGGFEEAMATRGGIALEHIDPKTMESRIVPGLYCIGEILDIDGDTGGYNLQAAFSTAGAAARHIRSLPEREGNPHPF